MRPYPEGPSIYRCKPGHKGVSGQIGFYRACNRAYAFQNGAGKKAAKGGIEACLLRDGKDTFTVFLKGVEARHDKVEQKVMRRAGDINVLRQGFARYLGDDGRNDIGGRGKEFFNFCKRKLGLLGNGIERNAAPAFNGGDFLCGGYYPSRFGFSGRFRHPYIMT